MENLLVKNHFQNRSKQYNTSSNWVIDENLIEKIYQLSAVDKASKVLDIATGTGLVAKRFYHNVAEITGIDISEAMLKQAKGNMDKIVVSKIEYMPFSDNNFDICICRQGLQFTDLALALSQVYRVLKIGGRVIFAHLVTYPTETNDHIELTFKIQALRNKARRNFFKYNDMQLALNKAGFKDIKAIEYKTTESINQWINHGAIDEENKSKIKNLYISADESYKRIHNIIFSKDNIFDDMLMLIVTAVK